MSNEQQGQSLGELIRAHKTVVGIAAVVVVVVAIGAAAWMCWPKAYVTPPCQYTCDNCLEKWTQTPTEAVKCPKCGGGAMVITWYQCPGCKKVFAGSEARRVEGRVEFRPAGTKQWLTSIQTVSCPQCRQRISNLDTACVGVGNDAPAGR